MVSSLDRVKLCIVLVNEVSARRLYWIRYFVAGAQLNSQSSCAVVLVMFDATIFLTGEHSGVVKIRDRLEIDEKVPLGSSEHEPATSTK